MKVNPIIPSKTPYPPGAGSAPAIVRRWRVKGMDGVEEVARSFERLDESLNVIHKALRTGTTSEVIDSTAVTISGVPVTY